MDPSKTSFLPALNIASKINKGMIEFINNTLIIPRGNVVEDSQAFLLK
jgi:hypothetical protein